MEKIDLRERLRQVENPPEYVSAREFARITGVSSPTVTKAIAERRIPAIMAGHTWCISTSEVLARETRKD